MPTRFETATLGAGCYWCVEAVLQELNGVDQVVSGYATGPADQVTEPAEVVQVTFDPDVLTFDDLLYVFWRIHDPTTLNRQGADVGPKYRSVIFYHSAAQQASAERSKAETDRSGLWPEPIVTELTPFGHFSAAEAHHQNYYRHNLDTPYCQTIIDPKVKKFRQKFAGKLKVTTP